MDGKTNNQNPDNMPLVALFTTVTPLSNYLAIVLFIAMPFIGGWIGYHYGSERVQTDSSKNTQMETGQTKIKNDSENSNTSAHQIAPKSTAVSITLEPLPRDASNFFNKAKYTFTNGKYAVSFIKPLGIQHIEQYEDPQIFDGADSFLNHYFEANEDGSLSNLLTINIHKSSFCREYLCKKNATSTVLLPDGSEWEYLGDHTYCDVGYCDSDKFVYRRTIGEYIIYLSSDSSLLDETNTQRNFMLDTLTSLKIELQQ